MISADWSTNIPEATKNGTRCTPRMKFTREQGSQSNRVVLELGLISRSNQERWTRISSARL